MCSRGDSCSSYHWFPNIWPPHRQTAILSIHFSEASWKEGVNSCLYNTKEGLMVAVRDATANMDRDTVVMACSSFWFRLEEPTMSVISLTVYLLAVFGISNLYVTNGKPVSEFNNSLENDGKSHSDHPLGSFHPLDEDWLKVFSEGFHETEDDDGHDGNSQSGFDNPTETTTTAPLGFDFSYLFKHKKHSEKNVNDNKVDKSQVDDNKHSNHQNNFPDINDIFDPNPLDLGNLNHIDFDQNIQGFHAGSPQTIDPFPVPFPQNPNYINFGHQSYSVRNRGPVPVWAGHGYSNGLGFPLPQFFHRGFGGY